MTHHRQRNSNEDKEAAFWLVRFEKRWVIANKGSGWEQENKGTVLWLVGFEKGLSDENNRTKGTREQKELENNRTIEQ